MGGDARGLDTSSIVALVAGIASLASFALALTSFDDPYFFLLLAFVSGIVAFVLAIRARREEAAAVALGVTAAGTAILYGVTLMAALTAMVYAAGMLLFLVLLFFLLALFARPSSSSSGSSGCTCPDCSCTCCEPSCDACACGSCDCGSGGCGACDCGGCGGSGCAGPACDCGGGVGGGGCGCIGFGLLVAPLAHAGPPLGLGARLERLRRQGMPHHPPTDEFLPDVYVLGSSRWCIGCFTTYPVFLLAFALLLAASPPWTVALLAGGALAALQGISSAGLARRKWMKVLVKTSLGVGLALVVTGIHSAPWPTAAKLGGFLAALALCWLSALPRARRNARRHEGHACAAAPETQP